MSWADEGWVCDRCEGSGYVTDPVLGKGCVHCRRLGVRTDEYLPGFIPTDHRVVSKAGLCEVCGARSFSGQCSAYPGFHQLHERARAQAELGYVHVTEATLARARAKSRGGEPFAMNEALTAEVHRDEMEDVLPYLPLHARVEFLAVERVRRDHMPLWLARILELRRSIDVAPNPGEWEALRVGLIAAQVAGYTKDQQTQAGVHLTPLTNLGVIRGLRWLAWAWSNERSTQFPKEAHGELQNLMRGAWLFRELERPL